MKKDLLHLVDTWTKLAKTLRRYGAPRTAETVYACIDDLMCLIQENES